MKKLLIALSAVTIALSCAACGNNEELEALRKENEELKQSLSVQENSANNNAAMKQALSLNQPLTVDTEYGSYKVTLTGAEIKDWRERSQGLVDNLSLLISYTVENIDFSNEQYPGCLVNNSFFYVYDDNKTLLETSGVSYDTEFPDTVLPGYNGQFNICYDLKNENTKYIDVILHRTNEQFSDQILGQIRIELQ